MDTVVSQITRLTIVFTQPVIPPQIKKAKLRVAGLCEGISLVTGEIPAQRASNVEYVFIWWRHDTNTCTLL